MDFHKISALVYRDLLIFRRSKWRIAETIYFPVTAIIIWGFFAVHSKTLYFEAGLIILIVSIFWNFAYVGQSNVNMQMIEDSWSGSLKQLFLSGVSEVDYIFSRLATSTIFSVLVLALLIFITSLFLGGFPVPVDAVIMLSVLTLITSLSMGVLVMALIITFGKSYSFLGWTALQAFVLLSAPFFPRDVFPGFLRYVSNVMPFTNIFQAARDVSAGNPVLWQSAIIVTACYAIFVWPVYLYCFRMARKNGKLVRLS